MSRMANVYKIELMVIDHEQFSEEDVKDTIENMKYLSPTVIKVEKKEVDWDEFGEDNHPLNITATSKEEFKRLFKVEGE